MATHAGLTGTTFDVPDASLTGGATLILRVSSERTDADGTFASLQAIEVFVQVRDITFDSAVVTWDSGTLTWDDD